MAMLGDVVPFSFWCSLLSFTKPGKNPNKEL
jgi:hypothetical protein